MTRGIVNSVVSRTVNTKYGPKPVYDIIVEGTKYSWGFKAPAKEGITDGADIEFETVADRYGPKVVDGTVTVHATGTGAAPTRSAPAGGATSSKAGSRTDLGFPVPATSEKISIIRQNSLTQARELVCTYPSAFGVDCGDGDKLVEKILDLARTFTDFSSGRDIEKKLEKMKAKMEE